MEESTNGKDIRHKTFLKLRDSESLKRLESSFGPWVDPIGWWIIDKVPRSVADLEREILSSCPVVGKYLRKKGYTASPIRNALVEAQKSKSVRKFAFSKELHGFVYPLYCDDRQLGFIGTCYNKKEVSTKLLSLFSAFTDSVVREVERRFEVDKLYETVRPRAIALSTVHTVHRLISSTLDINELLPRIARLSLQIIRAYRCSIKLVDSKRKVLLPKTTVDLRTEKTVLKKVRIGRWAPGKAVKLMRPIRGDRYLAVPLIDEDAIGVITIYDKIDKKPFTTFDQEIMQTLAEQAVIAIKNAQLYKEQEKLTSGGIKSLAAVLEAHRPKSYAPKAALLKITLAMAQELNMDQVEQRSLEYSTILHDAGQMVVPEKVLAKPSKLTGKEYDLVKEHPIMSVSIIKPMRSLKSVIPIILHHHENYDGTGYPKGLKKEQIPLGARIMAVVGSFEAMIAKRPYRTPLKIDDAVEEIKKNSGTQFDPRIVDVFLRVVKRRDIRTMLEKELDETR